jgi:hypothetical protein
VSIVGLKIISQRIVEEEMRVNYVVLTIMGRMSARESLYGMKGLSCVMLKCITRVSFTLRNRLIRR